MPLPIRRSMWSRHRVAVAIDNRNSASPCSPAGCPAAMLLGVPSPEIVARSLAMPDRQAGTRPLRTPDRRHAHCDRHTPGAWLRPDNGSRPRSRPAASYVAFEDAHHLEQRNATGARRRRGNHGVVLVFPLSGALNRLVGRGLLKMMPPCFAISRRSAAVSPRRIRSGRFRDSLERRSGLRLRRSPTSKNAPCGRCVDSGSSQGRRSP